MSAIRFTAETRMPVAKFATATPGIPYIKLWDLRASAVRFFVIIFAALSLIACEAAPTPRTIVHIEMTGSDSMYSLVRTLADDYVDSHPYAKINVQATNSDLGLRVSQQISGTIGMVARQVKPAEIPQSKAVVIARDGIAIIVNKTNPINAITRQQLAQVFSGEIPTWPLGPMTGKRIEVISREEGSGTRDAFETMVMQNTRVTRTALMMPNEAAVVDYVAHRPEAIAYTSMSALTQDVHALSIDDVPLSPQTVESKQYPFIRAFALIVPQTIDADTQDFVNYVLGNDGQKIVGQHFGRVP